ncbi:hypothetical protein [Rhodococcus erythropolis]
MTAPDPGLTDLIATHTLRVVELNEAARYPECNGCDWVGGLVKDHAVHLASVVEQHTNGRHEWPKTTPTGFTYERPTTYAELEHMIGHMVQSEIECWDEPERPPEPVWEMVGIAQQEVNRMAGRVTELESELEKYRAEERRELEWARNRARDDVRCPSCNLRYGERDQYGCIEPARAHDYDADELHAALEGEQQ